MRFLIAYGNIYRGLQACPVEGKRVVFKEAPGVGLFIYRNEIDLWVLCEERTGWKIGEYRKLKKDVLARGKELLAKHAENETPKEYVDRMIAKLGIPDVSTLPPCGSKDYWFQEKPNGLPC